MFNFNSVEIEEMIKNLIESEKVDKETAERLIEQLKKLKEELKKSVKLRAAIYRRIEQHPELEEEFQAKLCQTFAYYCLLNMAADELTGDADLVISSLIESIGNEAENMTTKEFLDRIIELSACVEYRLLDYSPEQITEVIAKHTSKDFVFSPEAFSISFLGEEE